MTVPAVELDFTAAIVHLRVEIGDDNTVRWVFWADKGRTTPQPMTEYTNWYMKGKNPETGQTFSITPDLSELPSSTVVLPLDGANLDDFLPPVIWKMGCKDPNGKAITLFKGEIIFEPEDDAA